MRIENIHIQGIGPIKELSLAFDPHFNIICGENGIGKSTILDCLAQSFSLNRLSVKRNAFVETGAWTLGFELAGGSNKRAFKISLFHPNETQPRTQGMYQMANDVIVFKSHRDIRYKKLEALSVDPTKDKGNFAGETVTGSLPDDIKNWFVNRYLFSAQPDSLDEGQQLNFETAVSCFGALDERVEFKTVLPNTFDIILRTPTGEVYFEYLSSGYKSCLALLLGLIKEIEFRYRNPSKYVKEFDGIILIDEIDLHLHPEWQARIYEAIKEMLPRAQIFTSTHSPHIIQVAKPNEVIPLVRNEEGETVCNPLVNEEFGCQGWTVEEILTGIMRMTETRTSVYLDTIKGFNSSMEQENYSYAFEYFQVLDRMLHPDNPLRKVLRIQLAGLPENDQVDQRQ